MSLGIRQHDNPLRYFVPSETRPGVEHLVDLAAYRQNGQCTCEHFVYRCQPQLTRGALPGPLLRCNHIEKARDYFISQFLQLIAKQNPHVDDAEVEPVFAPNPDARARTRYTTTTTIHGT